MKDKILLFLKGLLMGAADVIPGISGGTIALITGIYPKLIKSLSDIDLRKFFRTTNFGFLIPLGLGIILSIYSLSGLIESLLVNHADRTYSFFIGLILASTILLYQKARSLTFNSFIAMILGFLIAYMIAGLAVLNASHSVPVIFISGILAISAMILPGISGAFILLLLNQYEYLISALHSLDLKILSAFAIGALVGLLGFSKLLNSILKKYYSLSISLLIGLMLGSLRVPLQKISTASLGSIIIWIIVGFVLVIVIEKSLD
ncbi:MAG TPA: DUF368 domain-containing protein [Candidatus Nanoarchaeia archaeon]|nr:DUF368 domain-containing protein [Candidatus Nanoarchaeia archaeon]